MYLIFAGNGNVIHLTGIAGPSNSDSNASHLFYVSGVPFAKAVVIEEPLSSIKGNSMAIKNNEKDLFWRYCFTLFFFIIIFIQILTSYFPAHFLCP